MSLQTVVKFSSNECGVCHRMSHYDSVICNELGLDFVSVILQDTDAYRRYRHLLLAYYPTPEQRGWPTYLVVSDPEGEYIIHGGLKGGIAKGDFRTGLAALIAD